MENLPLWMEGLNPELIEKASKELKETPETKKRALIELRKLINDCPDLHSTEDDYFFIKFLRAKKYNVKKTFLTMKNYYEFKRKYPGVMTDTIREIINMNIFTASPIRSPAGAVVVHAYLKNIDFEKFDVYDFLQTGILLGEHVIYPEATQICGIHVIFDFQEMGLNKLRRFANPKFLALLVKGVENCWPVRLASAELINEPFYITLIINILWPLLSKKIKGRLHFHGSNIEGLQKTIPPECLAERFGGTLNIETLKKVVEEAVAKQIEDEQTNKYSFHRIHKKPVKKRSVCSMEENAKKILQKSVINPKVTIQRQGV